MSFSPPALYYRHLLKQTAYAEMMIQLPNPGGLLQAVRSRYRQVVSKNLQLPHHQRLNIAKKQQVSFYRMMNALEACPQNETLRSIAVALSTGTGNEAYRATLFRHFAETLVFDAERTKRDEASAQAVAHRQNKLMQTAVFPYLEKLCTLNDPTLQNQTSADPMLRALAPRRAGVTIQLFPAQPHYVAVEIDESLNKQTIFVSSGTEEENNYNLSVRGQESLGQRVDSAQLETQPGTILHLEWMNRARYILHTLTDESNVHRSRGTVVVGHGVGGAVATALAVMLQSENFALRNVVSFGAPKVIEEIEDKHVAPLNSIRVALSNDPMVNFPVSGTEGGLFHHVGELLVVHSKVAERTFARQQSDDVVKKKVLQQEKLRQKQQQQQRPHGGIFDEAGDYEDAEIETDNNQEEVDPAEVLFQELNQEAQQSKKNKKSTTTTAKTTTSADDVNDEDQQQGDASSSSLLNPFSSVAYRVALADPDAHLEYFEEDAAVWEADELRDSVELEEDLEEERLNEVNRTT